MFRNTNLNPSLFFYPSSPLFDTLPGGQKFDDKFYVLSGGGNDYKTLEEARKAGANVLAYGHLVQSIVDFIIIALCIFIVIRAIVRMYRRKEEALLASAPSPSETLLAEIRDLLRKQG